MREDKNRLSSVLETEYWETYKKLDAAQKFSVRMMFLVDSNTIAFFLGLMSSVTIGFLLELLGMKVLCNPTGFVLSAVIFLPWLLATYAGAKLLSNFSVLNRALEESDSEMNVRINILMEQISKYESNVSKITSAFNELSKTVGRASVTVFIAAVMMLLKFILVNFGVI